MHASCSGSPEPPERLHLGPQNRGSFQEVPAQPRTLGSPGVPKRGSRGDQGPGLARLPPTCHWGQSPPPTQRGSLGVAWTRGTKPVPGPPPKKKLPPFQHPLWHIYGELQARPPQSRLPTSGGVFRDPPLHPGAHGGRLPGLRAAPLARPRAMRSPPGDPQVRGAAPQHPRTLGSHLGSPFENPLPQPGPGVPRPPGTSPNRAPRRRNCNWNRIPFQPARAPARSPSSPAPCRSPSPPAGALAEPWAPEPEGGKRSRRS